MLVVDPSLFKTHGQSRSNRELIDDSDPSPASGSLGKKRLATISITHDQTYQFPRQPSRKWRLSIALSFYLSPIIFRFGNNLFGVSPSPQPISTDLPKGASDARVKDPLLA